MDEFGGTGGLVGEPAGEEDEEEDAERIDVAGRGDGAGEDLFGAGIFGGEGSDGVAAGFGGEQAGDAEIEQLGRAVGGDEDVARFEIAVDDEVAMGVLDGLADGQKERRRSTQESRCSEAN